MMNNPLFGGQIGQLMQVVNTIQQIRQNPAQLGQLLFDRNLINQNQLNDINQMGGNTAQIGNYLMSNNIMTGQQANQLYQNVPQVQQALK